MLNVDPKTVRWERRRIDVKRDGEKYVTLYSTEDLPERVIEVSSSLPGALGSAYQRVDEMLSGYTSIPANGKLRFDRRRTAPLRATSTRGPNVAADGVRAAVKGRTARGLALFASLVLATAGAAPARHPGRSRATCASAWCARSTISTRCSRGKPASAISRSFCSAA
jgi:hypothetical protein